MLCCNQLKLIVIGAALLLAGCDRPDAQAVLTPPEPLVAPTPIATPLPADRFAFPLDPAKFGPYVQGVTGPLDVDTRFGVQNNGLGRDGKCFVDKDGRKVPFNLLYHAGEDWFALDGRGQVEAGAATNAPVRAIANGVVDWAQDTGGQGQIVVIQHRLADSTHLWSAYWHLDEVTVSVGEIVARGEVIGVIADQGFNSHLHWEIRTWGDGRALFLPTTAGGRGTCNGRVPALGYTWDDLPARARPETWGYLDPVKFIRQMNSQ